MLSAGYVSRLNHCSSHYQPTNKKKENDGLMKLGKKVRQFVLFQLGQNSSEESNNKPKMFFV